MSAAVQTLDISPVGRVEGDLDIRVDIENGVVVNAWTQAEMFRGFEVILKNKDPQAGLVVTPRACGICGASHLSCAAWALDSAWGTTRSEEHTSELQSLMRISYAVFCLKKKKKKNSNYHTRIYVIDSSLDD